MAIKDSANGIIFENRHAKITLDKKSAAVTSVINLYTNEEICAIPVKAPYFAYLEAKDESIIPATEASLNADVIKFTFENAMTLDVKIECFDDFFTAEVVSDLDTSVRAAHFGNINTTLTKNCGYVLNGIGMSAWTKPVSPGFRDPAPDVYAAAYTYFPEGVRGAKLGFALSKKSDAMEHLKKVVDAIDPKVGLTSKAGGPYAREWEANYGDYAIITDLDPEKLDESLRLCKEFLIDQYDIHQIYNRTFVQGDFRFVHTETGSVEEYKNTAGKKIADAGLITAIHSYAYYLSPFSNDILSNPYWQKQLKMNESYTLSEDIDGEAVSIPTVEDASGFDTKYGFLYTNMSYVLLDEEIIKVNVAAKEGLVECVRGYSGTKAVPHKKGAVARKLDGVFAQFTPVLGNELFYHVADNIAKTYNEGGFDMLYFDAIDGAGRHIPDRRDAWYYHQKFIHRVLSQCERTPLIETSSGSPSEWNFRGRSGAWDYANMSIKKHIKNHATKNIQAIESGMTATLGWFCFFTDEHYWGEMKNTNYKTLFHDDMDYLGKFALAYDMTMVYHPLPVDAINNNPYYYSNLKYYTDHYTRLRKNHYFKPEIIERLKDDGEWRVVERGEEFAVQQMWYEKANLGNIKSEASHTFKGTNPYKKQKPFIRIESRFSTLFSDPVLLAKTSSGKPTLAEKLVVPTEISDIDMREAMTIRVKGTGRDGDAALISISGGVQGELGGRIDHFIDLNFEGWREFLFLDMDNADYDTVKYPFDKISTDYSSYDTFRFIPLFTTLKQTALRLTGETAEKAEFEDLICYPQAPSPIKNPTVKIGDSSFTFNCEMKGGEYVEFDPETGKALLYHNMEQTVEEVTYTSNLEIPEGDFEATYYAESTTDAPLRAKVVIGFIGDELMN